MAVLRLSEIHAAHVERIRATWSGGPSSDVRNVAVFAPMLVAVYRDRKKRTTERVMVANTPEERVEAAETLGDGLGREGIKPFAVTQAIEAWLAPDDGGGALSGRADRIEVLSVSTAQADGRTLSTIIRIARSEGGEAALGEVVVDAEAGFVAALSARVFHTARFRNNGGGGVNRPGSASSRPCASVRQPSSASRVASISFAARWTCSAISASPSAASRLAKSRMRSGLARILSAGLADE